MDSTRVRASNVKGAAFHKQARDNLQSILENFICIINLMKIEEYQYNQSKDQLPRVLSNTTDDFEMRVRANNMVNNKKYQLSSRADSCFSAFLGTCFRSLVEACF